MKREATYWEKKIAIYIYMAKNMYTEYVKTFYKLILKTNIKKKLNTHFTKEDTVRTKITENGIQCF